MWGVSAIARAPVSGPQCDRVLMYLLLAIHGLDTVTASLWPPALPRKGRALAQLTDKVEGITVLHGAHLQRKWG